jgi:hypothetical protein
VSLQYLAFAAAHSYRWPRTHSYQSSATGNLRSGGTLILEDILTGTPYGILDFSLIISPSTVNLS